MSVINQVLNRLEQRGAHTLSDQTMVRAVPQAKRNFTLPLLVFAVALIAGIAVWKWLPSPKPKAATVSAILHPSVVVVTDAISGVPADNPPAGLSGPATRLSFELSSVPLPSSIRTLYKDRDRSPAGQAASTSSGQALQEENLPESNNAMPVQPVIERTKSRTVKTFPSKSNGAVETPDSVSPMKQISPAQLADAEFRKAVALMQQGRITEALAGYEQALRLDASHDAARQALVALLLENKRGADAERVLQERLNTNPENTGFAMLLARLQVDHGAVDQATATLEKSLPYSNSQADYLAFLAALLQRQNRNEEAIKHYQVATQLVPGNGVWLMGYGISLQAVKRNADAKAAFNKALQTQTLSPELKAFVQQRLKEL